MTERMRPRRHEFECERCWWRTIIESGPMPSLSALFDAAGELHREYRPDCGAEIHEWLGRDVTSRDPIGGCGAQGDYGQVQCVAPVLHDGPHGPYASVRRLREPRLLEREI